MTQLFILQDKKLSSKFEILLINFLKKSLSIKSDYIKVLESYLDCSSLKMAVENVQFSLISCNIYFNFFLVFLFFLMAPHNNILYCLNYSMHMFFDDDCVMLNLIKLKSLQPENFKIKGTQIRN